MIIFKTTKCIEEDGRLGYKIENITALNRDRLPQEYLKTSPNCVGVPAGIRLNNKGDTEVIKIGYFYDRKKMKKIILECTKCGDRLQKINEKILKDNWHGEETINI